MKFGRFAKYYSVATQGIFSIVGLTIIGLIIGFQIGKDTIWPAILAIIGLVIGLFSFIIYMLKLQKEENKRKEEVKDETKS